LGSIIKSPLILAKKTINIHFSIATFLPASSSDTFIYKLLSKVEIFNIWGIVVLCIGIAIIGRFNIKKVWPIVVGLYTAWYIITSLISGFVGG
jgi:hypothetical protein